MTTTRPASALPTKPTKSDAIRKAAEADLLTFINLISPDRLLGDCHKELIKWWTRKEAGSHQLVLLPRDHQKSVLLAYRVVWELTKDPTLTFLYISATSNLAEKQLYFIKQLLRCEKYRQYWPEMINEEEGRREKWTASEIIVDHPLRAAAGLKDSSIFTAGLTTNITGLHFNVAALDDAVVAENAYTEEGRSAVERYYSLLASIETTGSREWVVGTRYHPNDLYKTLASKHYDIYNDHGELLATKPLYETFQRQVEDRGDGLGKFLWPKQQRRDGKWFGFDANELSRKRAQYIDRTQFWAQYYNNPNAPESQRFTKDSFQYFDQKFIQKVNGRWHFKLSPLNVFASIDFAYSLKKSSDYTSIVVLGVDPDNNFYVLDIDRFRTDRISEYFNHIRTAHAKWNFRKICAEVTAAQQTIVKELKDNYIRPFGMVLSIEELRPSKKEGTKEERITAILEPKYDNKQVWHTEGGLCSLLENELMEAYPEHDDIKDALANAVAIAIPPTGERVEADGNSRYTMKYNSRFGGCAFN